MCESWIYGCGHAIRTPCPRPKPTNTTALTNTTSSSGSRGSNFSNSTHSSPRRGSTNTTTSTDPSSIGAISKFCNGFPLTPKKTNAPCYHCILADAKQKIQLELPEVEAKKAELRHTGMTRTIARGPDGRYVDDYGNKIIAEEEYEQEFLGGYGARQRGFTGGRGNGNGQSARSAGYGNGNGYARGEYGVSGAAEARRNTIGDALAGNDSFRGGGPGGARLAPGFRPPRDSFNAFNKNSSGGSGFPTEFGPRHANYNNINNVNSGSYQNGNGNGGNSISSNNMTRPFAPPRADYNSFSNPADGHQASYQTRYSQQPQPHQHQYHFTNDFGGQAWGATEGGGLLGHGLESGIYPPPPPQQQQHSNNPFNTNNARRF